MPGRRGAHTPDTNASLHSPLCEPKIYYAPDSMSSLVNGLWKVPRQEKTNALAGACAGHRAQTHVGA